jgi:hypothetical protein
MTPDAEAVVYLLRMSLSERERAAVEAAMKKSPPADVNKVASSASQGAGT